MNDEGYVDSCDTMAKIGAEKGEGRSWQILWEADPNKDLGGKRKNPYMLFKGDQFHDDKGKPQIEKGDKVVVDPAELGLAKGSTEKTITSKKKALPKTELRLKIVDGLHKPAKKWKYKLKLGGETFTGQTEDDGTIVVKLKSDEVIAGDLEVTEKRTIAGEDGGETVEEGEQVKFKLHVGKLNPISDAETDIPDKGVSGVQARLHNLEFECGDINGLFNDPTRNATVSFLKRIDVKTTGGDGKILPDDKLLEEARKGLEKHHDQKADFPEVKQPSVKTPPPIPPKPGAKKTPPPIPPRPGTKKTPPPIPPRPGTKKTPPPIPPKPGTKKTPPPVPPKPKKPLGGGQ